MTPNQFHESSWEFTQNPEGMVALLVAREGGLMPTMIFQNPEGFVRFVEDAVKAKDRFVSKSVRDAIDVLKKQSWEEPKHEPEGTSTVNS
jgi:hypothetical protein